MNVVALRQPPPAADKAAEPALDEMCAPGGITWDEHAAFPNLADFESQEDDR